MTLSVRSYADIALPHLADMLTRNEAVFEKLADAVVTSVQAGGSLLVFGSGHSAIFPLEVYHRAGGPSFVIPVVADYLLPTAGPPIVRLLERTPGAATALLDRVQPRPGEMLWLASQSGINAAVVDLALQSKARKLVPVAFTSLAHSRAVASRHPSGKRLFEVCDEVVDLGAPVGDAAIPLAPGVAGGPLSTLCTILAAHSILTAAMARLEAAGVHCVYVSVNTPEGEKRNREIEARAAERDFLLRG